VVVVIMQVANYAEQFTTQQTRKAVCELTALAPATARVAATAPRSRSKSVTSAPARS
jgi:cation transport ATPase